VSLPYKIIYLTVYTRIYPFISIDLFISWFPCSGRKNVVTVGDAHVSWECKLFITITTTVSALWCKWQFIKLHWFDWPVVLIKGKCSNVNQASILQAPSSVRRCRVTSSDRHTRELDEATSMWIILMLMHCVHALLHGISGLWLMPPVCMLYCMASVAFDWYHPWPNWVSFSPVA